MHKNDDFRPDYDYFEDNPENDYDDEYMDDEDVDVNDRTDKQDAFTTLEDISVGDDTPQDASNGKEYQYSREDLIALMDKYHNGNEEDKKDVQYKFCVMLTPLIKHMIRVSRGIDSEYIDYIQHCYLYICKRLDRFDPTISFAFNYFKYVIQEAISACHESSYGKSSYETNIDRMVMKQTREFAAMGITPSPSRIASETGLSVLQVEDSLFRIKAEKPVLSEDMTIYERNDGSNLPLDTILKNEVSETLANAIMRLPDQEREAIMLSYNFYNLDSECSNKKIAEILHVSEIKVKELLISAKRHLKRDFSLDQLLGKSKRISQREYYFKESDPAAYSFNPESDAFLKLDEDNDESQGSPTETKQNIFYLTKVSDITFDSY